MQLADDPDFKHNVRTVFNNDYRNDLGFGEGKELEYFESLEGKLLELKGPRARYVRLHSNGSSQGPENTYLTVEVYGLPAK